MSAIAPHHRPAGNGPPSRPFEGWWGIWRYGRRALALVWSTHRGLTIALGLLTLAAGLMPAGIAYVGKLIVDAVVAALDANRAGAAPDVARVLTFVALEGALVAAVAGAQRGIDFCQSLLRVLLSQRVHLLILDKALTLTLAQFEDSEFYDKLNRARQEASVRPLSLVNRTFALAQNGVALISYAGLLLHFSPWAVAILVVAGLPVFIAETKFSGERFRAFQWRSPDRRMLAYLEVVLAREDHAKEVQLFHLGPRLMDRYRAIFKSLYEEEKHLTLRRNGWGFALGLVSSLAFYGAYAWIAYETVAQTISLGEMTMYLLLFKQGQSSVAAMLIRDRRHVRGQPVSLESLRLPRAAGAGRARQRARRYRPSRRNRIRSRAIHVPGRDVPRDRGPHAQDRAGPQRRARRLERLGQDDAREAARAACTSRTPARSAIRAAIWPTGTPRRCAAGSA